MTTPDDLLPQEGLVERQDFSRITLRHNIETILRETRDAHPETVLRRIMDAIPVAANSIEIEGLRKRVGSLEQQARYIAECLSVESQLAAPALSEEGRLRAKMGDCARTLFKALQDKGPQP